MVFVKQVYIWKFKKLLFIHLFIQLISLLSLSSLGAPPTSSLGAPPTSSLGAPPTLSLEAPPTSLRDSSCPPLSKLLTASSLRTLNNFLPLGFSGSPHLCSSHPSRSGLFSLSYLRASLALLTQSSSHPRHSGQLKPFLLRASLTLLPLSSSQRPPRSSRNSHSGFLSPSSLRPPHKLLAQGSLQECEGF